MQTDSRYFQLAGRDQVYLKFILEAYEGLTTMSTVGAGKGSIVRVTYPRPFAGDVAALLEALGAEIAFTELTGEGYA
jgi:hypothetical protein